MKGKLIIIMAAAIFLVSAGNLLAEDRSHGCQQKQRSSYHKDSYSRGRDFDRWSGKFSRAYEENNTRKVRRYLRKAGHRKVKRYAKKNYYGTSGNYIRFKGGGGNKIIFKGGGGNKIIFSQTHSGGCCGLGQNVHRRHVKHIKSVGRRNTGSRNRSTIHFEWNW